MEKYRLYAVKSWGSAIPELVLKFSQLPYEVEFLNADEVHSGEYKKINPLEQIPSMRLPSGEIMTESLAISLYLNEVGKVGLVPAAGSAEYPRFLRWSVFLVGSIYSLAPYVDHPDWYVTEKSAQEDLRRTSLEKVKERFLLMEQDTRSPWFLGEQMSLIDLNLAVMTFWEPRREWFEECCPKIIKVVDRLQGMPEFKAVYANNNPN